MSSAKPPQESRTTATRKRRSGPAHSASTEADDTRQSTRRTHHVTHPSPPCAGARARCLGCTPRGELWWALLTERGCQTRGAAPACSARRGYRSRNPCRRPAEGGAEGAARFGCGGDATSSTAGAVSPSSGSVERRRLPGEAGEADVMGSSRSAREIIIVRQSRVTKSTTRRTRRRARARRCLWFAALRRALRCFFREVGCDVCTLLARRESGFCRDGTTRGCGSCRDG